MSVTDYDEVVDGLKPAVSPSDEPYIQGLIDEAEAELETRLGDLATWLAGYSDVVVAPATVSPQDKMKANLTIVVRRMIQRVRRNQSGYSSETDGDYSYTRDRRVASGLIEASASDWLLLGVRRRSGARTIRTPLSPSSPRYPQRSDW